MDKEEQIWRFNSNLVMPSADMNIYRLPNSFIILWFTLHPIDSWDKRCKIMARVKKSAKQERDSMITLSHTLALDISYTIELDCIVFLFAKLLLPNIVNDLDWKYEIRLPHLNLRIFDFRILQLSKVLEDENFYWEYKDKLGVDLKEEHNER